MSATRRKSQRQRGGSADEQAVLDGGAGRPEALGESS